MLAVILFTMICRIDIMYDFQILCLCDIILCCAMIDDYYGEGDTRCAMFGKDAPNFGYTADQVRSLCFFPTHALQEDNIPEYCIYLKSHLI